MKEKLQNSGEVWDSLAFETFWFFLKKPISHYQKAHKARVKTEKHDTAGPLP